MTTPVWYVRYLVPGYHGPDVMVLRKKMGLPPIGGYDDKVVRAVNEFQRKQGIRVTGVVDSQTALALGEREGHGLVPDWYPGHVFGEGDAEWASVEEALGYDLSTNDLKRFQGNFRLPATGVVDEETAKVIHEFDL